MRQFFSSKLNACQIWLLGKLVHWKNTRIHQKQSPNEQSAESEISGNTALAPAVSLLESCQCMQGQNGSIFPGIFVRRAEERGSTIVITRDCSRATWQLGDRTLSETVHASPIVVPPSTSSIRHGPPIYVRKIPAQPQHHNVKRRN